jgi:hypothetical protein
MVFRIMHGKFRAARALLKLIIPITIALANYHIKMHPFRREPARARLMGDGGDEESNENNQARRL